MNINGLWKPQYPTRRERHDAEPAEFHRIRTEAMPISVGGSAVPGGEHTAAGGGRNVDVSSATVPKAERVSRSPDATAPEGRLTSRAKLPCGPSARRAGRSRLIAPPACALTFVRTGNW